MKNILITGASSDIGIELVKNLKLGNYKLGLHYNSKGEILKKITKHQNNIKLFKKNLVNENGCISLVNEYIGWAKKIDVFIQLHGAIKKSKKWYSLSQKDILQDLNVNFFSTFNLSKLVFQKMRKTGGKIVLTSTSSASHGGGVDTFGYGMSKFSIEYLTKLLAKEGGNHKILCNAIAPGFINTKIHLQSKTPSQIKKRASLNKLKMAGNPKNIVPIIKMLISEENSFMTGEIIKIDGGDWL